ncbi:MAG: hypothetical protein AVDCRST_MAG32-2195, partial [uncultured Nocardioides sp.]
WPWRARPGTASRSLPPSPTCARRPGSGGTPRRGVLHLLDREDLRAVVGHLMEPVSG